MCPPQHPTELLNRKPAVKVSQMSGTQDSSSLQRPHALILADPEPDVETLLQFIQEKLAVRRVDTLVELNRALQDCDPDVIFCPWAFQTGTWSSVVNAVKEVKPGIPVIVFSERKDTDTLNEASAWYKIFVGGGFDLLVPPFRNSNVLWVVQQAIESRLAHRMRQRAT
jgi:DNA-binding NtrC family response regulator